MRLVAFQNERGEIVMVNPNQVRCVVPLKNGSKIEFGPDHSISVAARIEAARGMLADEEEL
jgi:hypothetical protein